MRNINQGSFFVFFALFFIILLGEAKAGDILNLKQNDTVSNEVVIGNMALPLPEGVWAVVLKENTEGYVKYNSGWQEVKFPVVNILLAQKYGVRLKRLLRYIVNTKKPDISVRSWNSEPCKLDPSNIYFSDKFNSRYEQPECLEAHPVYSFLEASGAYWSDVRSWMEAMKISTPKTIVVIDYAKYTPRQFVRVTIWENPEQAGFKNEEASLAQLNGWNPKNLDQQKKAYISSLVDWSKGFAGNIRGRF